MVRMLLEDVSERSSLGVIERVVKQEVFYTFYLCPTLT